MDVVGEVATGLIRNCPWEKLVVPTMNIPAGMLVEFRVGWFVRAINSLCVVPDSTVKLCAVAKSDRSN